MGDDLVRVFALILVVILTGTVFFIIENNKVPSNIGIHDGKLSELKNSDNGVSTQTTQSKKKVDPLILYSDVNDAKEILIKAFDECGDYQLNLNAENYMHVIFISDKMKFRDDLEILIDTESNLIHYRSESRVGYSDNGVNLDRYNTIAKYYEKNSKK